MNALRGYVKNATEKRLSVVFFLISPGIQETPGLGFPATSLDVALQPHHTIQPQLFFRAHVRNLIQRVHTKQVQPELFALTDSADPCEVLRLTPPATLL